MNLNELFTSIEIATVLTIVAALIFIVAFHKDLHKK
jgi:hypothetical protein